MMKRTSDTKSDTKVHNSPARYFGVNLSLHQIASIIWTIFYIYFIKIPMLLSLWIWLLHPYVVILEKVLKFSDRGFFVFSILSIHFVICFGLNGFYLLADKYNLLPQYKVPRTPQQVASSALVTEAIQASLFDQFVFYPLLCYLVYPSFATNRAIVSDDLESFWSVYKFIFAYNIFNEIFFYLNHRMFHSNALYWLHKRHHEFDGTIGFAAEFSHPIDKICTVIFPVVGGSYFFGGHPLILFVFFAWRLIISFEAHSGYVIPGNLSA